MRQDMFRFAKVGDTVRLIQQFQPQCQAPISRLTRTLVIVQCPCRVGEGTYERRFRRDNGDLWGESIEYAYIRPIGAGSLRDEGR